MFQLAKPNGWSISPFCLKVEAYLRANNIDYEAVEHVKLFDRFSRHKLPAIQYNDMLIQDSTAIINFLEETVLPAGSKPSLPIDFDLDEKQRDLSTMVIAMAENSLVPLIVHFRWHYEPGWQQFKPLILGSLPFPLTLFVPKLARDNAIKKLNAMGTGLYTVEELTAQASKFLAVLSRQLGSNKFFFGDKFHTVDATLFGVLFQCVRVDLDIPVCHLVKEYDNLVKYVNTVEELISKAPHKTLPLSVIN